MQDEERLAKTYDIRLIWRLLGFAKPHARILSVSFLLVLMITALDLSGPLIIKTAIDDHINGLRLEMVDTQGIRIPEGVPATEFQGKRLVRKRELEQAGAAGIANGLDAYVIEAKDGAYMLRPSTSGDGEAVSLTKEEVSRFREQDVQALYRLSGLYLLLISAAFALNYAQTYTLNLAAQKIIYKIRSALFSHLQRLSFSFFDRNPVGRLVTRVTNDTQTLNDMYSNVMINLLKDIFMLLGIMGVMLYLNVQLALVAFITLPLIIAATFLYGKYAREAMREVRAKLARINASLNENITGMRVVQIFHREQRQYDSVSGINREHFHANTKELHLSSLYRPIMDFIYALGLTLILWYGTGKLTGGVLEFGVLYAFVDYVNRFFKPIQDLAEKFTILQQSMVSSERIFQMLDQEDDLPEPKAPKRLEQVKGEIVFENVSFAYNPGEWVLQDINLRIRPGETVAFVGATGAGKSSIISLLCRFYDVQKGRITIDGVDIRELPKQELRRIVGLVQQDVFLFSDSVKENIRLGNERISDAEIREICRYVNAAEFIEKLPKRYEEPIMERGANFSAGQRQLLAVARTLAFKPSILVLDEATANIDTETELLVQEAFEKISEGKTTLIVAHRLSTIQHADHIVVLHKGQIREVGSHQQLLNRNGLYRKLYELQYKESFIRSAN
ncbi:ABC transporter ATP-binding protein [Paenibacillus thermotolerans]|uniref:ABC transporter ATP-binding protein n=1 Tax=Paenibacillus thermotolerans TaxID=3027807 RepID=UPI002367E6AE|nr:MULTISPECIES: ABC transporter ATP-binding protein [unclassified Paenibacillus]